MSTVAINIESADFGRTVYLSVTHDVGDPGLRCTAMVAIPINSATQEIAQTLELVAQSVRQFDAMREDVKRERENVVTVPLSALDQIAERINAAGMVPLDADNPEHVAALVGLATKVQAASTATHPMTGLRRVILDAIQGVDASNTLRPGAVDALGKGE